jgi:hypothetical protein
MSSDIPINTTRKVEDPFFVVKRDKTKETWDGQKIVEAVAKAFRAHDPSTPERDVMLCSVGVYEMVLKDISEIKGQIEIEELQDVVEKNLLKHYFDVGKHYVLYRAERTKQRRSNGTSLKALKSIKVDWKKNGLGWFTLTRTYARHLDNDPSKPLETAHDIVCRILHSAETQLGVGFTKKEALRFGELMLQWKLSVAGRFLWQMGTPTVEKLGLPSLQNCAFIAVDEPIRPFTWTFDMLMLGCGVGASIQREHTEKIPRVADKDITVTRVFTNDCDFIVPDNREGWIKLLKKVMKAFLVTGKSFTFSTNCIRPKGTPIKSFGGVASGPEELCKGIQDICNILRARRSQKLRPIDCGDIICTIGLIVVSGNVRRSAILLMGDADDKEYIAAKNWSTGTVPNCRAMANNSVVCSDIGSLPDEFWEGYKGNGEPYGLINLDLSRKVGRLGETQYPDPNVVGYNPW